MISRSGYLISKIKKGINKGLSILLQENGFYLLQENEYLLLLD